MEGFYDDWNTDHRRLLKRWLKRCLLIRGDHIKKLRTKYKQWNQEEDKMWFIGQILITCDIYEIVGMKIQIIDGDHKRWLPSMGGPHKKKKKKRFQSKIDCHMRDA